MSVGQIACEKEGARALLRQDKAGDLDRRRRSYDGGEMVGRLIRAGKLVILVGAGLLLGALIGIAIKLVIDLDPFFIWYIVGFALFIVSVVGYITTGSKDC